MADPTSKEETPLEKIRFWEGVAIEGTVVHDLAKTAIAEIERLTKALTTANANHEHFERLYYLEIQKHESSVETKANQEPYTPEILLLRLVRDMERTGTETVWLSRARDHLRRTGYSPEETTARREYHANGTYWSGVPTVDMPCDFCTLPITDHDPRTHACPPEKATDPNQFECGFCDKTFATTADRDRHEETCQYEPPVVQGVTV